MVYFYVCIKANVIDIGALNYMFALRKTNYHVKIKKKSKDQNQSTTF